MIWGLLSLSEAKDLSLLQWLQRLQDPLYIYPQHLCSSTKPTQGQMEKNALKFSTSSCSRCLALILIPHMTKKEQTGRHWRNFPHPFSHIHASVGQTKALAGSRLVGLGQPETALDKKASLATRCTSRASNITSKELALQTLIRYFQLKWHCSKYVIGMLTCCHNKLLPSFKTHFILLHVWGFVCMHICTSHVDLLLKEVRKGRWIQVYLTVKPSP